MNRSEIILTNHARFNRFSAHKNLNDLTLRVIYEERDDIITADMEIRYDEEVDIAMLILSDKKLTYESEVENIVIGFSKDHEPIWLEILDVTKDFLPKLNKIKKISNHQRIFYSTKIIEICSCSAICLKFPSKVKK